MGGTYPVQGYPHRGGTYHEQGVPTLDRGYHRLHGSTFNQARWVYPPSETAAQRVLATRRVVCLLRSRRRTFLSNLNWLWCICEEGRRMQTTKLNTNKYYWYCYPFKKLRRKRLCQFHQKERMSKYFYFQLWLGYKIWKIKCICFDIFANFSFNKRSFSVFNDIYLKPNSPFWIACAIYLNWCFPRN